MDFDFIISSHFMGMTAIIRMCELGQKMCNLSKGQDERLYQSLH